MHAFVARLPQTSQSGSTFGGGRSAAASKREGAPAAAAAAAAGEGGVASGVAVAAEEGGVEGGEEARRSEVEGVEDNGDEDNLKIEKQLKFILGKSKYKCQLLKYSKK